MDNVKFVFKPGMNSDGEDGILILDGRPFTLQITMALDRDHVDWAAASGGTTTSSANVETVAQWIDKVIQSKVPKTDPQKTILALDANHLGVMADVALLLCYQERFRKSFAAVWFCGCVAGRAIG